jgi:hypothetical protein
MTDAPPPSSPSSEPPPPSPSLAQPPMPGAGAPLPKGPIGTARPIALTIVLSIITCGIYFLYWTYVTYEELKQHNNRGLGGLVGLLIGIFIGIVNVFVLPSEIQSMYGDDGRDSPVSPLVGLWVLLPLVGFIIWFVKVQGALNDYWVSKGATPA